MNLLTEPIARLEAMYNEAWRSHHNEIDMDNMKKAMNLIEGAVVQRLHVITGKGGAWEIKPLGHEGNHHE